MAARRRSRLRSRGRVWARPAAPLASLPPWPRGSDLSPPYGPEMESVGVPSSAPLALEPSLASRALATAVRMRITCLRCCCVCGVPTSMGQIRRSCTNWRYAMQSVGLRPYIRPSMIDTTVPVRPCPPLHETERNQRKWKLAHWAWCKCLAMATQAESRPRHNSSLLAYTCQDEAVSLTSSGCIGSPPWRGGRRGHEPAPEHAYRWPWNNQRWESAKSEGRLLAF